VEIRADEVRVSLLVLHKFFLVIPRITILDHPRFHEVILGFGDMLNPSTSVRYSNRFSTVLLIAHPGDEVKLRGHKADILSNERAALLPTENRLSV
jgi:hypothetical protein